MVEERLGDEDVGARREGSVRESDRLSADVLADVVADPIFEVRRKPAIVVVSIEAMPAIVHHQWQL